MKITEDLTTQLKEEITKRQTEDMRILERTEELHKKLVQELKEVEQSISLKCEDKFLTNKADIEKIKLQLEKITMQTKDNNEMDTNKNCFVLRPKEVVNNAIQSEVLRNEDNNKSFYTNYLKKKAELMESNKKYTVSIMKDKQLPNKDEVTVLLYYNIATIP
jgi:hypothetical protein